MPNRLAWKTIHKCFNIVIKQHAGSGLVAINVPGEETVIAEVGADGKLEVIAATCEAAPDED